MPQDLRLLDDLGDSKPVKLGDLARGCEARQDDDREREIGRADLTQDRDAVEPGQADVEHYRVRTLAREIREAVFPRVPDDRLVPLRAEGLR